MTDTTFQKHIPSYKTNTVEDKPLFFNHINKTGGTSLTGVLFSIAVNYDRPYQHIAAGYGLGETPVPEALYQSNAMVFAGHTPYGFHKNFHKDFNLVTIVRNPVERVLSHYFWNRRNNGGMETISKSDFESFMHNESTHNRCAKFMCGHTSTKNDDSENFSHWQENLDTYYAYCSTESLDLMASYILTHYGSASVAFDDAKKESDPRKLEFEKLFQNLIEDYNKEDMKIYQYVKEQENRFFVPSQEQVDMNPKVIGIKNPSVKSFSFTTGALR